PASELAGGRAISNLQSPHVVRMKMPREGDTQFHDLIRGDVTFKNDLVDDQVLMKSDGFPTYHLANVVDDHLMNITHVIRGEEWLPSTPKHIVLYQMFGWTPPEFAHLSLLVNEQKQKLSKRHGDVSVEDFKEKGYLPEALVNFIAFLGWNPGDTREIFSLQELEKEFSLENVGSSAAVFHREKLDWYNKQYIAAMNAEELAKRVEPFYQNAGINLLSVVCRLSTVVQLEQGRAATLADIVEKTGYIFADELTYESELLVWKKSTAEDAKKKLEEIEKKLEEMNDSDWGRELLEKILREWIAEQGYGVGDVLWPLRVALSGQKNSPGPFEIAEVLGKEKSLDRIRKAIEMMK
ncbi:MAG: glutamate--tRNA ligase, partial [Patescibacteria group bacterium]